MDTLKIGRLIYRLRKEKNLTQLQLAEMLNVSDKAVSKWERGLGCPEVSLLPELSRRLGVDVENLLSGELGANQTLGGNMKKLCFYVCPDCGNLVTALTDTGVTCCGKKLPMLQPKKAEGNERLQVESIENDFYITTSHPMEREHHLSFVALLTGDTLILRKQYPEWDLQARIPAIVRRGRLIWYCTQHGLFYQEISR